MRYVCKMTLRKFSAFFHFSALLSSIFSPTYQRALRIVNLTMQQQSILEDGNIKWLLLRGGPGTGKTLLIQAKIYSLCLKICKDRDENPSDVKFPNGKPISLFCADQMPTEHQKFLDRNKIAHFVDVLTDVRTDGQLINTAREGEIHLFMDDRFSKVALNSFIKLPTRTQETYIWVVMDCYQQDISGFRDRPEMPEGLLPGFTEQYLSVQLRTSLEIYILIDALRRQQKEIVPDVRLCKYYDGDYIPGQTCRYLGKASMSIQCAG